MDRCHFQKKKYFKIVQRGKEEIDRHLIVEICLPLFSLSLNIGEIFLAINFKKDRFKNKKILSKHLPKISFLNFKWVGPTYLATYMFICPRKYCLFFCLMIWSSVFSVSNPTLSERWVSIIDAVPTIRQRLANVAFFFSLSHLCTLSHSQCPLSPVLASKPHQPSGIHVGVASGVGAAAPLRTYSFPSDDIVQQLQKDLLGRACGYASQS